MKRTLACFVLAATLIGGMVVAASSASARPRLTSFYAQDEGTWVRLKVNFCYYTGSAREATHARPAATKVPACFTGYSLAFRFRAGERAAAP